MAKEYGLSIPAQKLTGWHVDLTIGP